MRCRAVGAASIFLLLCVTAHAETVLHAGRLIDGRGDSARDAMSLVIDQGRIVAIRDGYIVPKPGDTLIDLRRCTVMPGWMDMHTHLMSEHHKKVYLKVINKRVALFVPLSIVLPLYVKV